MMSDPTELPPTASALVTWRVHMLGPDDLIPMPNELEALKQANMTNIAIARLRLDYAHVPNYPWMMAVVERNGVNYTEDQCPNNRSEPRGSVA